MEQDAGRVVIGIGGMAARHAAAGTIVTHALGSCLGIAIHDPQARVGGMIHVQMPLAQLRPERAKDAPTLFVDLGVPLLVQAITGLGAARQSWRVTVAGGATVMAATGTFDIASRNLTVLRKVCWQLGLLVAAEDVGGTIPRTMTLDLASGTTTVESQGRRIIL